MTHASEADEAGEAGEAAADAPAFHDEALNFAAAVREGHSDETVAAWLSVLLAAIDRARAASGATLRERVLSLKYRIDVAAADYAGGVEQDEILSDHEYRDAWGFVETARAQARRMPIVLDGLLSGPQLADLREAAAALPWEDGAKTVGPVARAVKHNEQAVAGPATQAVLDTMPSALMAHPLFQAVACPRSIARIMVTRTRGSGHYGPHVDNALIAGARTDVSLTLFLSDPDSYEGGALVIADRVEDRAFKLPAGSAIVYPATTLHHVQPVTAGARLVAIGWVQSWVRDPAQREILFDLWRAQAGADPAGDVARLLSKTRSNLLRMWVG